MVARPGAPGAGEGGAGRGGGAPAGASGDPAAVTCSGDDACGPGACGGTSTRRRQVRLCNAPRTRRRRVWPAGRGRTVDPPERPSERGGLPAPPLSPGKCAAGRPGEGGQGAGEEDRLAEGRRHAARLLEEAESRGRDLRGGKLPHEQQQRNPRDGDRGPGLDERAGIRPPPTACATRRPPRTRAYATTAFAMRKNMLSGWSQKWRMPPSEPSSAARSRRAPRVSYPTRRGRGARRERRRRRASPRRSSRGRPSRTSPTPTTTSGSRSGSRPT